MPLWNAKTRQVSKLQINFLTTKHVNIFNPNPLITCLISVKCGHFCKPFNFLKSMSPVLNRLSDRPGHNKVLPTLTLVRIRQEGTHFITVGLISSTLSDYETKHQLMRRNKDKVRCKIFNPNPLITCLISVKCGHFCKPFNFLKSMSPVLNRLSDRPGHNKVLPTLTLVRIRQEGTHFITVGLISSTLSDYETKHQLMRRNKDKVRCKTYFQNNYFIRLALSGWN